MPFLPINAIAIGRRRAGVNWSSYWATRLPYFNLPTTGVKLLVGNEVTIYGDSLLSLPIGADLTVTYTCDIGSASGNNYTINPTVDNIGDHSLRIVCVSNGVTRGDETITLSVYNLAVFGGKKVLMIGDSTIAGDLEQIGAAINNALTGETITYLGTQGSAPYLNEGYGGYSWQTFATSANSPFVKAAVIDIPAYFTDNSIDTPDIVYFRLGINEMYGQCTGELTEAEITTILGYADDLVDAFLAFDVALKIVIAVPTICQSTSAAWELSYDEAHSQNTYIEHMHRFWGAIITKYAAGAYNARVGVTYEAIHLSRADGYTNALHLDASGNAEIGKGLASYINQVVPNYFLLTSDGDGSGIAKLTLAVSSTLTLTMEGNARFYTDAAATENESATWEIASGSNYARYIRCSSGVTKMKFSDPSLVIRWGATTGSGWDSSTDAPILSGDIGIMPNLTVLRTAGKSSMIGDLTNFTALTYLYHPAVNGFCGDVGVNNMTEGIVTFFNITACKMVKYTGGATWGNAAITINPSAGYGYSAAEIDAMLIDMAASPTLVSKTITLQGANAVRTPASDAAVATLEGVGRTCTLVLNT